MGAPFYQERDEFEGAMLADKYSIVRRIGRGGMGSVYQATHVLMDRTVAIKIVRTNYAQADPACLQRFRLEAKASSCLNHPNIMTVYDFGITEQGLAYLVMDYIDGIGLDVVMRSDLGMDIDRVVEIFLQACQALAHAHDKGVVHRDLKPSNLMLATDENGRELVKIVDFGIAKMLPGRSRAAEVINDGGQVIGSPLYMSPEQCMGDDQDGRSDIYSLGCLLYEVLTGAPPISDKHVLGIMYKHMNEPPKPFATVAPECQIPPALEAVVLKALAKNPNDRHQSMRDMAIELQSAMAVAEKTHSELKYVQRANPADYEFFDSDESQSKLEVHASGCDPIEQHYIRKLRSALDQFGAENPDVVPSMHHLADYYISRNKPSRAERQLKMAIELLVANFGPWDARVADAALKLAELYRTGGRPYDAEPLYLDLVAIKKTCVGANHPDIPFLTLRLAELYLSTARISDAYKYYSKCLRSAEAVYGQDDPVLSAIIVGLAAVLLQMGELEQAAWLYHRALELNELNLGINHPAVIGPLVSLGLVYRRLENWPEAEASLYRAVTVHRENFDADNSEICHAYWLLAEIYSHHLKHENAEALYEHVLKFFEGQSGVDEAVAQLYNNYGVHFLRKKQMSSAETQFLQALKIRERSYGKLSPEVASSLNLIATLYHSQEKLDLAEEYYRRSLASCGQIQNAAALASENLRALGDLYTAQNRFAEAGPAYMKALKVLNVEIDSTEPRSEQTQQILSSLSNLHLAANGVQTVHSEDAAVGEGTTPPLLGHTEPELTSECLDDCLSAVGDVQFS